MHSCRIQPLQVVQCDRRIDSEAEDTCPEEVPEAHSDEAVDRPLIGFDPFGRLRELIVVVSLHTDEYQRHDLQSAEGSTKCQHRRRRSAEVEVVEGTEDPPREEDNRREEYRDRSRLDT